MNNRLRDGRKHRLVTCAKIAFASKGYYATSISHIVQEAGIARGTFYQYFDNKLHLLQSILDSFLQDLSDSIKPILIGPGVPPPLSQIEDNLSRVLDLVRTEKELTQILLHHTGTLDATVETRITEFYQQVAEMIQRSLNLGIAMNLVRPCDTLLTAYSIIGAVKEVVFQFTSSQKPQPTVDNLVEELLHFGMKGILAESRNSLTEHNYTAGRSNPAVSPMGRK